MTVSDITIHKATHPLQRFNNSSVLYDNVAVVMSPTKVVRTMVQDAKPQFGDVKKI